VFHGEKMLDEPREHLRMSPGWGQKNLPFDNVAVGQE